LTADEMQKSIDALWVQLGDVQRWSKDAAEQIRAADRRLRRVEGEPAAAVIAAIVISGAAVVTALLLAGLMLTGAAGRSGSGWVPIGAGVVLVFVAMGGAVRILAVLRRRDDM
jgi:protein-S-isoprenylcysteine O-methyltransferase Ste14